ncbi:MAG: phosphohydrolase [Tannerellaceae bacterium]|nr:phosphohydrolase [Tannerellaceae bacterium]
MDSLEIINRHYSNNPKAKELVIEHGRDVARKALDIICRRPDLCVDPIFIKHAAVIHDIGIIFCNAPEFYCFGEANYICHGYLGSQVVSREGFPAYALICERHTGTGITVEEILRRNLPIPCREMLPVTIEEKLICYADKFFSKGNIGKERSLAKVREKIAKHGEDAILRFEQLHNLFEGIA